MNKQELIDHLVQATQPPQPMKRDWKIGCIGSGFIMKDCHLVAYHEMGFHADAITSLHKESREAVAKQHNIHKVYDTWKELLNDESLEIIDIAIPPHLQPEVVEEACKHKNIRGILCQKPVAMTLKDARRMAELAKESGIKIAVNSNMRYDQSMRALKYLLNNNILGDPVLATIEMRAIPHWQKFLQEYNKLEIYGMGIHHVDIFRYLFGDPEKITAVCRTDPRTQFPHFDGITQYTYQYSNDMMCTSLDDVWAWPNEPCEKDTYIKWRVEGLDGMAKGTIGWPSYPAREPSTLTMTCKAFPHEWITPSWNEVWFPDAFRGTMSSLMCAVESDTEPEISISDNVNTIGCVEACYQSIKQGRTIELSEVLKGA